MVVHVLLALVRRLNGDVGVAQALALADDGRSFATLGDMTKWSPLDKTVALFNAAALVTGDGAVGLHVGEGLLYADDGTGFVNRLRALGSPESAFKHATPLLGYFDGTSEAVALEVATDHALIEVLPRFEEERHAHLCEMTRGLLSQVPALYGAGRALVSEHECSARGGRTCRYALSWEVPEGQTAEDPAPEAPAEYQAEETGPAESRSLPDESPGGREQERSAGSRAERAIWRGLDRTAFVEPQGEPEASGRADADELRAELDRMSALIEGAFSTATELVSADVESLLSQIAARADAVVASPRYLLMLRVRPGTAIQLHYRGLEPDEAQIAAAELWREHPDDDAGSRLIVDIASPHRLYGRLAEFHPTGKVHTDSQAKVLRLFAEYAAASLDVFTVLTEAKRSDATARTLLSFSESLSQVTSLADLLQLVVDTVPAVTDCAQATMYLWDAGRGQLVPRSWTRGRPAPDGSLVPIVAVAPEDHPADRFRDLADLGEGDPLSLEGRPLTVGPDNPLIAQLVNSRAVIVLDETTGDPALAAVLERSGTEASVVASLFAGGHFLGVIAANFGRDSSLAAIRDADLHERLSGLADQAATTLQNLELLERVSHMAWHDALTGLPNRRLFEDRVEQELVRSRRVGEPVCMFFVDLDHFKAVNDSLGHAAGDDLIQQVSERLVDTVRRQDTVARVGGDEFAILLPGLSDQLSIDQLAQRALEAMSTPFDVSGVEVETSASIGIAMAPDHGDSYDELLSRADEAMYRAKGRGRNAFQMFSGSAVTDGSGRLDIDEDTLYADLVHALEHEEFFVLYQPYIDLRTGEVVGVEALVRWQHPRYGLLEPASFISLAEQSDLIVALDSWVMEQACRQARTWLDHGLTPLRMSVNLASRDLASPDLFEKVDQTLEETGVDPSLLELEITERVVLDRAGPARDNIDRLRRLGVRFTIDDFGTGNSSLNRIGSFPVSTLKIDQSFVQVLGPDGENNTLVSAIISMADRLGLSCVAEGVETSLQSRILLQRGCTTAQGYFFSPPLAPQDVETMMANIAATDGPSAADGTTG